MSLFPRFTSELTPLFRLMDDYERHAIRGVNAAATRSFSPKFDVKELKDAYELHGEFPGVEQKDINIEWSDANTLTISGRHETVREEGQRPQGFIEDSETGKDNANGNDKKAKQPTVEDENAESQVAKQDGKTDVAQQNPNAPRFWVSERSVGEFHRSFNFPARVDQDAVKASLKNGILSILVPKAKAQQPRKIAIE
ncbi:HSP20-like chaperone [Massariosphaeria phaeospora]|uniref:HSP20-like chaperone n=1 Tax=Massariosphaeria phaeospora TaxID=100035 RepID=A0A7C8ICP5_9PLEO|nr:HSP20-like chaperone [Massariosphaeria phaeospora]